jgi:hypothetical protein
VEGWKLINGYRQLNFHNKSFFSREGKQINQIQATFVCFTVVAGKLSANVACKHIRGPHVLSFKRRFVPKNMQGYVSLLESSWPYCAIDSASKGALSR